MIDEDIKLSRLKLPSDLKKLTVKQCGILCREIRTLLIKTVSENGGHLSSNLGTVELTVSLHRVFDSPKDKIVWDVGHQSYTHKILTGRLNDFGTIRLENGISGFARPSESEHDPFISGHSSISVSAACGIAAAMQLEGDTEHHVIAVMGDGAFTGGEAYEGLNNAGKGFSNIIVILNDNGMSISHNVGAIAKYLTKIRGNEKYVNTKHRTEIVLDNMPIGGKAIKSIMKSSKSTLKWFLYHSTMFEDMGFVYLGPVDGHDISALDKTLSAAKAVNKPVIVHVKTTKGKGFLPAERNPGAFHGVSSYDLKYGNPEVIKENSFSAVFGHALLEEAKKDERICAVTAAMKYATGLQYFAAEFPERFFDVGIAEEHAVTFCCGLAAMGKLPVFSVYSSFLQRSFDQLIHDAAIQKEHIVLCIDRAGIVGEDGETHQGLFDVPMLSVIPGTVMYSPAGYNELKNCLKKALYDEKGIAVVRYPKGEGESGADVPYTDYIYDDSKKTNTIAVSYGRTGCCLSDAVSDTLRLVKIHPISDEVIGILMKYDNILFFEESMRTGGIGMQTEAALLSAGFRGNIRIKALDGFVAQAKPENALAAVGLDSRSILSDIENAVKNTIVNGERL